MEGKIVVASGHLPPPAHLIVYIRNKNKKHSTVINKYKKHSTVINKNQSLFFFPDPKFPLRIQTHGLNAILDQAVHL